MFLIISAGTFEVFIALYTHISICYAVHIIRFSIKIPMAYLAYKTTAGSAIRSTRAGYNTYNNWRYNTQCENDSNNNPKTQKSIDFSICLLYFFGSNGSLMEVEFMDPILIFFQAFIDFPLNCFGVGFCLYLIITT